VEAVSDDEAELGRGRVEEFDFDKLLVALAIKCSDVTVRFSLGPVTNLRVKAGEVMGGSV
jgi:hypothetical protein